MSKKPKPNTPEWRKANGIGGLCERRWALESTDGRNQLLGEWCWYDASTDNTRVRTFRTRAQARTAREDMRPYHRRSSRVVPVEVIIRIR